MPTNRYQLFLRLKTDAMDSVLVVQNFYQQAVEHDEGGLRNVSENAEFLHVYISSHLPARKSASASFANRSSFPALTSASNCLSHTSASTLYAAKRS